MENASKALIMAGGVLISLLVISLLVYFFNDLRDLQSTKLSTEQVQQATEFNKQYDVYTRDLYGSEILGLANKIVDYNKRESNDKGYSEVTVSIKIDGQKIDTTKNYFNETSYTINKGKNTIQDELDSISNDLKKYSSRNPSDGYIYSNNSNTWSRTISQLSNMRDKEWIEALDINDNNMINKIRNKISEYNTYKNLESQFKQSKFKYINSEYDKNTGRITKLEYELI